MHGPPRADLLALVKQAIALQRIIPFFRFFGKTDKQFDTPGGALVLHWVISIISIVVVPKGSVGYSFNFGLFGYGRLIVLCKKFRYYH